MEWGGQDNYQEKKYYLALQKCKNEENFAKYKKIKITINVALCDAKLKTFKKVFDKLERSTIME